MNARVHGPTAGAAVTEEESGELSSLLRTPASRRPAAPTTVSLGRIVSLDAQGVPSVELSSSSGSIVARLGVTVSADVLAAAIQSGQQVVLAFENGDPGLPIIIGLIQPPMPAGTAAEGAEAITEQVASGAQPGVQVEVDGKRLRIVAQDEVVLECGKASITLRRNGRVVIRGTYVETYSDGTNRIKGGQVRIN